MERLGHQKSRLFASTHISRACSSEKRLVLVFASLFVVWFYFYADCWRLDLPQISDPPRDKILTPIPDLNPALALSAQICYTFLKLAVWTNSVWHEWKPFWNFFLVGPFITCRGNDVGPVFGVGGGTRTQVLVTPESRILNERTKMHSVRHKVDQRAGLSHVTKN